MSKVEKTDVEWSITVDGACINQICRYLRIKARQWWIKGKGTGSRPSPIKPVVVFYFNWLDFVFSHREDRRSLFNWLTFLLKRALLFGTIKFQEYLTIIIIPRAQMGSESIVHEAESRMGY